MQITVGPGLGKAVTDVFQQCCLQDQCLKALCDDGSECYVVEAGCAGHCNNEMYTSDLNVAPFIKHLFGSSLQVSRYLVNI